MKGMRKLHSFIIIALLVGLNGYTSAQVNFKPTLGLGASYSGYSAKVNDGDFWSWNYSVKAGGVLYDQIELGTYLTIMDNRDFHNSELSNKVTTNSYFLSYRILKTDKIISPLIEVNSGFGISSSAEGKVINGNYTLVDTTDVYDYSIGTFDKVTAISKVAVKVDIIKNNFQLAFGPTYGVMKLQSRGSSNTILTQQLRGFGVELNLSYRFSIGSKEK